MTAWLLRLVRWIAGPNRSEWAEAMAAEADAAGSRATSWAMGCVGAVLIDRLKRSAATIIAVTLLPAMAFALAFVLLFPTAWMSRTFGLPQWALLSIWVFEPLPLAILLGWLTGRRGAFAPAVAAFCVYYAIVMVNWWTFFGQGPSVFFDGDMEIHHLHAQVGMAVDLGVWLLGALIGARWYQFKHA